jgi:hypothetical protein
MGDHWQACDGFKFVCRKESSWRITRSTALFPRVADAAEGGVGGFEAGGFGHFRQTHAVVNSQFAADGFAMVVRGVRAATKDFGDLWEAEAFADQGEDFEFAPGEDVEGAKVNVR